MTFQTSAITVTPIAYNFLKECFPDAPDGILDMDEVLDAMGGHRCTGVLLHDLEAMLALVDGEQFYIQVATTKTKKKK